MTAMSEWPGHDVHCGPIQALLYGGGFVQKDHHWFAAVDPEVGARQLGAALLETLVPVEQRESAQSLPHGEYVRIRVQAIRGRLAEIIHVLHETR